MLSIFVMTVDVDPPFSLPSFVVEKGIFNLLETFDEHAIKATFFVPAIVAEKFSAVVNKIAEHGHEIGCHGLNHDPWEATLDVTEQMKTIRTATKLIQLKCGLKPVGYRAPLFRINRHCWMALQQNDYIYDSSIVGSPFYIRHKTIFPKKPFFLPVSSVEENRGLLEIPVSVNPLLPFPIGGVWMRIWGSKWCKIGVKMNFMFRIPMIFYIHPKDVVPRCYGREWYSYKNTSDAMEMVNEIINYAKRQGTKFLKACEVAKLYKKL